jgi:hypothetical protein
MSYCTWSRFFIFSTHHIQCTSVTNWCLIDGNSFVLGLICYIGCHIVTMSFLCVKSYLNFVDFLFSFLWVVSTCVSIYLVLLLEGSHPWFLFTSLKKKKKKNQNLLRYHNFIINLQVSTQAKISSFKNPRIKIDLLPRGQYSLSYYII